MSSMSEPSCRSARRLISFSLWGDGPKYCVGAVRNAELAADLYPGWTCRFYLGGSVPAATRAALGSLPNVELVELAEPGDWRAMLWRFRPAFEEHDAIVLVRDADSRLSRRERAAVDDWLAGDFDFHIMRDHPFHDAPILGGMWGARNGILRELRPRFEAYPAEDRWQTDQHFLRSVVFPRVELRSLVHDEITRKKVAFWPSDRPFPTRRRGLEFVGEPFDAADRPLNPEHRQALAEALRRRDG